MGWKSKHCQQSNTTPRNLQIQYNLCYYPNNSLFAEMEKLILKLLWNFKWLL